MKAKEYFNIYGSAMVDELRNNNQDGFKEVVADMTDHMFQDMCQEHSDALDASHIEDAEERRDYSEKKFVKLMRSYNQKWNAIRSMCREEYGQPFIRFDGYLSTVLHFMVRNMGEVAKKPCQE